MGRKQKWIGAVEARTHAIIKALWVFQNRGVEATYNKLYEISNKTEKMPRQIFWKRLEKLVNDGLVTKKVKEESKLTYKPSVYRLTKNGMIVATLNNPFINWKMKLVEESKTAPLEKMFSLFYHKMCLAVACAPLFLFVGHSGFISFFAYDMMATWTSVMKERAATRPEEFLGIIPQALALTTAIGGAPLSKWAIDDIKERIRQAGADPDDIFRRADTYREAITLALTDLEKRIFEKEGIDNTVQ